MKESKLIEMSNKIDATGRILQQIINELENMKTLVFGNHAVMKKLNEYPTIIKQLENEQKENANGTTTGDSGTSDSGLELE